MSNKPTTTELAIYANAPSILVAGYVNSEGGIVSPPSESSNIVRFAASLPGPASEYIVMLTTISGGSAYVAAMLEDDDDNFSGFMVVSEEACDVMFIVTKVGMRPRL